MSSRTQDITREQMQNLISKMPENKYRIPRNRLKVTDIVYDEMLAVAKLSHRKNPKNNVQYIITHITENVGDMKDRIYHAIGYEIKNGAISHYELAQIANSDNPYESNDLLSLYIGLHSFYLRAIVESTRYELSNRPEDEIGLMLTESLIKRFTIRSIEINDQK